MKYLQIIETLQAGIQHIVHKVLEDMEDLDANHVSLAVMAALSYNDRQTSHAIDELYEGLLSKQLPNGSWANELWPTGFCLVAIRQYLDKQGKPFNPRAPYVRKALDYVKARQCEQRWNWEGEFLETILLCWVFLKLEHRKEYGFVEKALQRLQKIQTEEGGLFDIYDTAMALCAFYAATTALNLNSDAAIERALQWLRKWEPVEESVWNRAVMLFMISEISVCDREWADSIIDSLLDEMHHGVISDDHDEQAMTILALSCYSSQCFVQESAAPKISLDNLLRLATYKEYLQSIRNKIISQIEAVNARSTTTRIFVYTDAFVANRDALFGEIENHNQFKSMITSFYMVFYEASGAAKRLPQPLLDDNSIIWKIKHLRTSVQHDFQHGEDRQIEKKAQIIEDVYLQCCGKSRPYEVTDYQMVQIFLLDAVESFLSDLCNLDSLTDRDEGTASLRVP